MIRRQTLRLLAGLGLVGWSLLATTGAAESDLFDAAGFRIDRFRAPVDRVAGGVTTVDTAAVQALGDEALRIDTTPLVRTGETDFSGLWLQNKPRPHLPGSIWLPNVGRMPLDETVAAFFRDQLVQHTADDRTRPLVFYCYLDCWMSWNAARQAALWGYTAVYWYPEGTDGWADADLPMVEGTPIPLFEE